MQMGIGGPARPRRSSSPFRAGCRFSQLVKIGGRTQLSVRDAERVTEIGDELTLAHQIRVGSGHSLEFNEATQPVDLVKVDPDVLVDEQVALLLHNAPLAQRGREGGPGSAGLVHANDPVGALTLLRTIGALELDDVWLAGRFLSEFQDSLPSLEVGVPLPNDSVVGGSEVSADPERTRVVWVSSLQLDVSGRGR